MILMLDSNKNKTYKNDILFLKEYYKESDVVRVCLDYKTNDVIDKIIDNIHKYIFIYITKECENCKEFNSYITSLSLVGCKIKYKKNILNKIDKQNKELLCIYKYYINEPGMKARIEKVINKLKWISKKYNYENEVID